MPDLKLELLDPTVVAPSRATAQSAGYDVQARFLNRPVTVYTANNREQTRHLDILVSGGTTAHGVRLYPGERAMIPLGFKATLPDGFEAQVRPRSGMALKEALVPVNSPGTIDADYPNEWMVLLENRSLAILSIVEGQKVAQVVFARYAVLDVVEAVIAPTTDRTGGFGSTDVLASDTISVATLVPTTATVVADAAPVKRGKVSKVEG